MKNDARFVRRGDTFGKGSNLGVPPLHSHPRYDSRRAVTACRTVVRHHLAIYYSKKAIGHKE
jgi:hypothetical protein